MIDNRALDNYCQTTLASADFKDYCPNGLQIEGKQNIAHIVSGVSANLALIKKAINHQADAIFVHHGFFWQNENPTITGAKKEKIALLLKHNINLFAFHLPLDAHPTLGNNIQLGKKLNIENPQAVDQSLLWQGTLKKAIPANDFAKITSDILKRETLCFAPKGKKIRSIAWCTGAGQGFIDKAIGLGVDAYLSGEVSEQTPHNALENNIAYLAAGHHATERYGVQALCQHLSQRFALTHRFIEIKNTV